MTTLQKIKDIEEEYARTQKNKATSAHLGMLKAKLAKLKRELISDASAGSGGGKGEGFDVTKTGDCRVGLVGFPSVGKSTLLTALTGVFSEAAGYEFTTLTCIPGVIHYNGSRIQLLDLPGIIEGAKDGKGRGRQVIAVARTCNMLLIVLDALKPLTIKTVIERELDGFGIRLNQRYPNATFKRKDKGGINLSSAGVKLTHLDPDICKRVLSEYRIHSADISCREDITVDQLIDMVEGNRVYMPAVFVLNKADGCSMEELKVITKIPHSCPISAYRRWNLDGLLGQMWDYLAMYRIYTKPKGMMPDYSGPVVLSEQKRTVEDFCNKIHKGLLANFKYAIVWGASVRHVPQRVGKEHVLEDEDVIQVVKKV